MEELRGMIRQLALSSHRNEAPLQHLSQTAQQMNKMMNDREKRFPFLRPSSIVGQNHTDSSVMIDPAPKRRDVMTDVTEDPCSSVISKPIPQMNEMTTDDQPLPPASSTDPIGLQTRPMTGEMSDLKLVAEDVEESMRCLNSDRNGSLLKVTMNFQLTSATEYYRPSSTNIRTDPTILCRGKLLSSTEGASSSGAYEMFDEMSGSVQVYNVQACFPKDSTTIWKAECVHAQDLFMQPLIVDNCLRANRFCDILDSTVQHKMDEAIVLPTIGEPSRVPALPLNNDTKSGGKQTTRIACVEVVAGKQGHIDHDKVPKEANHYLGEFCCKIENQRAELLECSLENVDAIVLVAHVAFARGMTWDGLALMVKDENQSGNPVAGMIKILHFERDILTFLLGRSLDDMDDDVKTIPIPRTGQG